MYIKSLTRVQVLYVGVIFFVKRLDKSMLIGSQVVSFIVFWKKMDKRGKK